MAPNSTRLQRILGCKLRRRVTKCPGGVSETPTGFSLHVEEGERVRGMKVLMVCDRCTSFLVF